MFGRFHAKNPFPFVVDTSHMSERPPASDDDLFSFHRNQHSDLIPSFNDLHDAWTGDVCMNDHYEIKDVTFYGLCLSLRNFLERDLKSISIGVVGLEKPTARMTCLTFYGTHF